MQEIILTHECDECDTEMRYRILNLTENDNTLSLSSVEQIQFVCPECGLEHFTGELQVYNENEM